MGTDDSGTGRTGTIDRTRQRTSALAPVNHLVRRQAGSFAESGSRMTFRGSGVAHVAAPVTPPYDHEIAPASRWPLKDFLEFGPYPGAVPCARLHAKAVLWEWELADLSDSVELIVSELVTNAVTASQSLHQISPIRLWLLSDRDRILILVWDASPKPPSPAGTDTGDIYEGGRGLMLVDAISEKWSWYFARQTAGKVVWALCSNAGAGTE
jgi:anti-sigma regulatory factor (Ser/Thr protein kinase)